MALQGQQFRQILDALLDGYDEFGLRQMVRFGMNQDLDRIAGGSNLEERVFNLVTWSDRTDSERELIQAAHEYNPDNSALKVLYDAWFSQEARGHDSEAAETLSVAEQTAVDEFRRDSPIEFDLAIVAAGDFTMSAAAGGRTLNLPAYGIATAPVSNAQFKAFMDASGHRAPRYWNSDAVPRGREEQPVTGISWDDAQAFCRWLTTATDTTVRLPSEAEWEKAMSSLGVADGDFYEWTDTRYSGASGAYVVKWMRRGSVTRDDEDADAESDYISARVAIIPGSQPS